MAVLRGASRQVLSFIAQYWVQLIQISAVPVSVMLLVSVGVLIILADVIPALIMIQIGEGPQIPPDVMTKVMRAQGYSMLANLLSAFAMVWLFVRIVRFYALGEMNWFATGPAGLKPILLTALYGIGVVVLTLVAYFVGLFVILVLVAIVASIFGDSAGGAGVAFAVIFTIAAVVSFLAGLAWFFYRFAVALPGVALGQSPDFFKGMWPLSRGESWGLPLRMMASGLLFSLVVLPLMFIAYWPIIGNIMSGGTPAAEMIHGFFGRLILMSAIAIVLQVPWMWFSSLLLAEAYRRFSGTPGAPAIR